MNNDIYAPPQSTPEITPVESTESDLASRGARLGGSLLDSLIMSAVTLPIMYFTGGFDGISDPSNQPSLIYNISMGILGLVIFAAINLKLLVTTGQTIGKKIVGTKIVTMDGNLPTLKENLIKRYAVFFIPGQIPLIGQVFSLVNALFIFGKAHRCVHDYAGKTKVVKIN